MFILDTNFLDIMCCVPGLCNSPQLNKIKLDPLLNALHIYHRSHASFERMLKTNGCSIFAEATRPKTGRDWGIHFREKAGSSLKANLRVHRVICFHLRLKRWLTVCLLQKDWNQRIGFSFVTGKYTRSPTPK